MDEARLASADIRGTMIRHGNIWRINNALVEEVSAGRRTGYLVVSYAGNRSGQHDIY